MRKFLVLLLMLVTMIIAACSEQTETIEKKNMVLYSQLGQKFTEELLTSFAKNNKNYVINAVYELKEGAPTPDLIIAERNVLLELQDQGALKSIVSSAGDMLPAKFKNENGYWYGAFYDPTVFLVNQQFARNVGQEKLRGWIDLQDIRSDIRISMENISNSQDTINSICSGASFRGEDLTLNYLWNLHINISQYAKFPFTPIRLAAVGDADLAITRQSYVSQYLENNFPAYVIHPKEGAPVNLYCVAAYRDCKNLTVANDFINWLIANEEVRCISQTVDTGYMFLLPDGVNGAAVNPDKLWLNKNYIKKEQQETLVTRWLEHVRFSKNN